MKYYHHHHRPSATFLASDNSIAGKIATQHSEQATIFLSYPLPTVFSSSVVQREHHCSQDAKPSRQWRRRWWWRRTWVWLQRKNTTRWDRVLLCYTLRSSSSSSSSSLSPSCPLSLSSLVQASQPKSGLESPSRGLSRRESPSQRSKRSSTTNTARSRS